MKLISTIAICASLTACATDPTPTATTPDPASSAPCVDPGRSLGTVGALTVAVPFIGVFIGQSIADSRKTAYQDCIKNQKQNAAK